MYIFYLFILFIHHSSPNFKTKLSSAHSLFWFCSPLREPDEVSGSQHGSATCNEIALPAIL